MRVEYPPSRLGPAFKAPAPGATAESPWSLSLHPDLGLSQGRGSFLFTAAQGGERWDELESSGSSVLSPRGH